MIGTILFILAVAGVIYLVTRRNKKSNSGGGFSGGSNPPIIKDPNTDHQEEVN